MLSIARRNHHREDTSLIGYKFHKLAFAIDRQIDQLLMEQFDISLSQYLILYGAAAHPQTTQCAVARFLNLTQAAVSRQVEALVEHGYLTKQDNSENRRENILKLTARGEDILDRGRAAIDQAYQELLAEVSTQSLEVFGGVIDKLLSTTCSQFKINQGTNHGQN